MYTPTFAALAAINAEGRGMRQLPIVLIPTRKALAGDLPREEVRQCARQILDDVVEVLTNQNTEELIAKYGAYKALRSGPDSLLDHEFVVPLDGDSSVEIIRNDDGEISIELPPEPDALMEYLGERFAYDGLPVVPPTRDRVRRMLEYSRFKADDVVLTIPPRNGVLTARRLAAAAVMAGCKPEYLPVLEAAFGAMAAPEFNLGGILTTNGEVWPSVIVSGPYASEIGMEHGMGLFGPGNRANNTIGRAVTLALIAVGGAYPNVGTFATFGNLTRKGLAFAEDLQNPWGSYHAEMGYPDSTTVTVAATLNPSYIVDESESPNNILYLVSHHVAMPGTRGDYNPGEVFIIFNPAHADRLVRDGWTKNDIKEYVYQNARQPVSLLESMGCQIGRKRWPKWVYGNKVNGMAPFLRGPEDAIILTAGGAVAAHTAILYTWVGGSKTQTVPLALP